MTFMSKEIEKSFIVLAGGKNTRFLGRDKAFIRVLGKSMIDRVLDAGRDIFDEIIIVSNSPEKYKSYSQVAVVKDAINDAGPIGGLFTALKIANGEMLMVVSCDMPFLDKELTRKQVNVFINREKKLVIPQTEGFFEPMHVILSKEILNPLEKYLNKSGNRKLIDFFLSQPHQIWEFKNESDKRNPFLNINSYEDLELYGIHGYIGVLGFGTDVPRKNLLFAKQTGDLLAEAGWGILTGNTGGTFRAACSAALENGGLAKLIYSREDITGDDSLWPLKIEVSTPEEKHQRMSQIMKAAIVIGGGAGTLQIIELLVKNGKTIIYLTGTGGITEENLQGCVPADSPKKAIDLLNSLLKR